MRGVDGFAVPIEDVTAASAAARVLADTVTATDPLAPLLELAASLPGGRVALDAPGWGQSWTQAVIGVADRYRAHADHPSLTVAAYLDAEQAVAGALPAGGGGWWHWPMSGAGTPPGWKRCSPRWAAPETGCPT